VQHHSCRTYFLDSGLQEGGVGETSIGKETTSMLHFHPHDAGELTLCPLVSVQCATRLWQILWMRRGTMGDQSCQLARMPLPDFVIVLASVRADRFGWSARTIYEICYAFRMKWTRCHQGGRKITMYTHHGGVRVEQAKALPIVDNADVFAIWPKNNRRSASEP